MTKRGALSCILSCGVLLAIPGCKKAENSNLSYESAINDFYKAHPACLWTDAKKFPVQAATSDESKTEGYDALTDAGLLTRTTGEKKVMIIASKQVNNYDVSDKGRAVWTQDPSQPGYGNFCYGHRDVTSIDSSIPGNNSPSTGQTVQVNYHYKFSDIASWANSQEMRTAFPNLNTALSGTQAGQSTLVQSGNGWQVTGNSPTSSTE
jgi:hypothetical protein